MFIVIDDCCGDRIGRENLISSSILSINLNSFVSPVASNLAVRSTLLYRLFTFRVKSSFGIMKPGIIERSDVFLYSIVKSVAIESFLISPLSR